MSFAKTFDRDGYVIRRGLLAHSRIERIQQRMLTIMRPYCSVGPDGEEPQHALDRCFYEVSALGSDVKSNVYKMFSRLADLPLLLEEPGIRATVADLGFTDFTIQAYSIFCLEPGNVRHKFLPHQDLRNRTSLKSLIVWAPMSQGQSLGGMACWPGSHRGGPLKHTLSEGGQLMLDENCYAAFERTDLTDYEPGDVVFMNPYLIHESVENDGDAIRWTAVVKIDDIRSNDHLTRDLHPFPIEEYIDGRSNAERLAGPQ